jgi:hypothetical protein
MILGVNTSHSVAHATGRPGAFGKADTPALPTHHIRWPTPPAVQEPSAKPIPLHCQHITFGGPCHRPSRSLRQSRYPCIANTSHSVAHATGRPGAFGKADTPALPIPLHCQHITFGGPRHRPSRGLRQGRYPCIATHTNADPPRAFCWIVGLFFSYVSRL